MRTARERLAPLDGLRGIAIIVVVISHGWILWPIEWIDRHEWVRPLFRSGNFAVTVFLVVSGYLTYRALARNELARMQVGVGLARRIIRVAPTTLVVLPAMLIVAAVDATDTTASNVNMKSFLHIGTYTWNWYLQTDATQARWDLGHLWYLSVDMHAFLFMGAVLYFLRRRPLGLVAALVGIMLLLTWWRVHVTDLEPVLNVLLRTTARMDAFVAGVLVGAALAIAPKPRLDTPGVRVLGAAAWVALLPLFWYCSRDKSFLTWGVTLLELSLAGVIASVALTGRAPLPLTHPALVFMGRHSLPLYVWHYPTFAAVERHTTDWNWAPRTLVAVLVTAALCVATHYLVERHVSRLLAHPGWVRVTGRGVSPLTESPSRSPLRGRRS